MKSPEEIIKKWTKKKVSLERRRHQTERLIIKSDKAYNAGNTELWEAYEGCIEHQQNKMLELINELMRLQTAIENTNNGGMI